MDTPLPTSPEPTVPDRARPPSGHSVVHRGPRPRGSTRRAVAVLAGKSARHTARILGRGGTALPGRVAERVDPQLASALAADLPLGCTLVTGTNGKTTTTRLLAAAARGAGWRVVTNETGSNLRRGLITTLLDRADSDGRLRADVGILEVDEATLPTATRLLRPTLVVVLNLFRDQMDRYGELDQLAGKIGRSLAESNAVALLNADDPAVAALARYLPPERVRYFGIEETGQAPVGLQAADADRCPDCGRSLVYTRRFYAHLGHYACPEAHFVRPVPRDRLGNPEISRPDRSSFTLHAPGGDVRVNLALPGLHNACNALAAVAAAGALGIPRRQAIASLADVRPAFGRGERLKLRGRGVRMTLVKNPVGLDQALQGVLVDPDVPLLLAVNDLDADGRDVSWLWDADLEALAGRRGVVASGTRAFDLAVRLRHAGVDAYPEPDLAAALDRVVDAVPPGAEVHVLPTYTAMLRLRRQLGHAAGLAETT